VFIRTSGCNLRCVWCDTPYASWNPEGEDVPVSAIVEQTLIHNCSHVVITGGEPYLFKDLPDLAAALREAKLHITLETAGTLWQDLDIDLASVSPKLANSTPHEREGGRFAVLHETHRINLDVLRRFATAPRIKDRQWKFVIASPADLTEVETLLSQIGGIPPTDVLLMPEGTSRETLASRAPWLAEICKTRGYRYCPRLHVELWGNKRGT
jgi:7-carboxy-7-deazaguanine synthase